MNPKVILGAHLREDERVRGEALAEKKIHGDSLYAITLAIYPPIPSKPAFQHHLYTFNVLYKQEGLLLIMKMGTTILEGDADEFFEKMLEKLQLEHKGPMNLVHDAKKWCNIPFTKQDEVVLLKAGIKL